MTVRCHIVSISFFFSVVTEDSDIERHVDVSAIIARDVSVGFERKR